MGRKLVNMTDNNQFDETKIYDLREFHDKLANATEKKADVEKNLTEIPEEKQQPASRVARYHQEATAPVAKKKQQQKNVYTTQKNAKEKMIANTSWLTFSNIFSRLLGAVYIIPWLIWMRPDNYVANSLFTKGYNIYALFLMISTAGIPSAIAKQTARYNSVNEYGISRKLLFYTLRIMAVAGVVFAAVMYLCAPLLSQGNAALIPVMRSLSVVLIIFPAMSVIRGFFQGNSNMKPYAISQIVEQVARIIYMLAATYIIMQVNNGNYKTAVVQSTFAAFIGVIFALAVLLYYLAKERHILNQLVKESNNQLSFSGGTLLKEMVRQAIPFIVVGSGISIFKLIDQYTFEKFLGMISDYSTRELSSLFALVSANPDKLTMVVIALGTSMATAGLPLITEKYTKKEFSELASLVSNNLKLFFFTMMPASIGMIVVAYPLNTLFYQPDRLGTNLLIEACLTGVLMGLFLITSSMLQGLDGNHAAIAYLMIGIGVKFLTQFPLIFLFKSYGPLLASFIGMLVANLFILDKIHQKSKFPIRKTFASVRKITIISIIMGVLAFIAKQAAQIILNPDSQLQSFLIILIVAAVGGFSYMVLALKTKIADELLGARVEGLRRRLRIK